MKTFPLKFFVGGVPITLHLDGRSEFNEQRLRRVLEELDDEPNLIGISLLAFVWQLLTSWPHNGVIVTETRPDETNP
ncbi:MAG: hypothetical protein EHM35_01175 [Planctomycetaceae bacterium]|nr:MAG: hypothetical protein EHM35_01175 [Planctomycetaceae bacterium]